MSALAVYQAIVDAQTLQLPLYKDAPIFTRNLEKRLDDRRKNERLYVPKRPREAVDFSSNDFLSISSSGLLRSAFLEEMAQYPHLPVGTAASRLLDGNSDYLENLEHEIASFHGAETALMFGSGYDANVSIFEVIPLPGDAIVYDELVHASIHKGMQNSRASIKKSFSHNDPTSLAATLRDLRENHEPFRLGTQTMIIAVESVYSMDGTVAPLVEFVHALEEVLPHKNWEIVMDEAHSTGLVGKHGRGLVCALGLEDKIAIRLHTCGEGLGNTGAAVLSSASVRNTLLNYAHPIVYSSSPTFPTLAATRAAYKMLANGQLAERQERLQQVIRHFYTEMYQHEFWDEARSAGILDIPSGKDYQTRPFLAHIVPLWTRNLDNHWLAANLQYANYKAWPIDYPVVPRDQGRVRLIFHADNSLAQVDGLVETIAIWIKERLNVAEGHEPKKRELQLRRAQQ